MNEDLTCFPLDENNNINLLKIKSKDFYWLLVNKAPKGRCATLGLGSAQPTLRQPPGGEVLQEGF